MAVFRDRTVEWDGEEYTYSPSARIVRRIEEQVPLLPLIGGLQAGNLRVGNLSYVVAEVLKAAGAAVNEDDVMCYMHDGNYAEKVKWAMSVVETLLPGPSSEKKPDVPAEKA